MNNFRDNMVERKEKLMGIRAVKIGCMDEDDLVGEGVVKIGVAGTGAVKIDGGNQELYSNKERAGMAKAISQIFGWSLSFSKKIGVATYSSSHPECGAGGAQGFTEEGLIEETKHLSSEHGITYTGHLDVVTDESEVPGDSISWFTRKSGPHTASEINITVGGGITGKEKQSLEKEENNKAFDISADWVDYALKNGADRNEIIDNLVFQFKLAYAIAEGVRKSGNPFKVYNGGRLDASEVSVNEEVVQEAVRIADEQIGKGNWKAAAHH